jgi:hypothetical protein
MARTLLFPPAKHTKKRRPTVLFYIKQTAPTNARSIVAASGRRLIGCRSIDMEWEQWFCPERSCATEAWLVRQERGHTELWSLMCRLTGASFTIAAVDPVCPRCGTTLCATVEFTHNQRGAMVLEDGPMLDFVRSLR